MFADDEMMVAIGFGDACARLVSLAGNGGLARVSAEAYRRGLTVQADGIPPGEVLPVSQLAKFQCGDLRVRGECAVLAIRWEAVSPENELLPVLDADLTVLGTVPDAVAINVAGVYRPASGASGTGHSGSWRRAATATIHAFLLQVATAITDPGGVTQLPDLTGGFL
jgi:hypothetical protein